MKKVIICGGHQSISALIEIKLRSLQFLRVVGKYRDSIAALRVARSLSPDIVIIEGEFRGRLLTDMLTAFNITLPDAKIVLFTATSLHSDTLASFRPDSVFLASKNGHISQLLKILTQASATAEPNDTFSLSDRNQFRPDDKGDEELDDIKGTLTDKELRILTLIAMSNTNKEVANAMGISVHTVSNYRSKIMYKLSANDQAALVRYAITHGLIDPCA